MRRASEPRTCCSSASSCPTATDRRLGVARCARSWSTCRTASSRRSAALDCSGSTTTSESREPTVEISHEALFRAWPRLATWIEEGEDDLRLLGHLSTAAADWDAGGREESELYRGSRLDSALGFAASHPGELSATEEAFLGAGLDRRAREQASTRRTVQRLRVLTGGLAVGLALALVAGGLAWTARSTRRGGAPSRGGDGPVGAGGRARLRRLG
jgi:hypothetical protein